MYETIVEEKFSYALSADETTWEAWATATEDPLTYFVDPESDQVNAEKFSGFLIYV